MEELIKEELSKVDESNIENVIEHLKDLGMICSEDYQYVHELCLTDLLKAIQIMKLLSFFGKYCSNTAQPDIVCNIEFEEEDNQIVSKNPLPIFSSMSSIIPSFSNSSIPSTTIVHLLIL